MKKVLTILLLLVSLGMYAEGAGDFGNAKWIGATSDKNSEAAGKSVWLRRSFMCHKPIKKATLNICGLGAYEVYLNYEKIGGDIMAPAWSDYNKTVFYNTIDMTDKLHVKAISEDKTQMKKAANMIYVLLGNGFFHNQGGRYNKTTNNYGPQMLLFHLEIEYQDGTRESIDSDAQRWLLRNSPITFNSIYGGEDYDASLETPDSTITAPEYLWHAATTVMAPRGHLRKQIAEPLTVASALPIKSTLAYHVFDMGQNISGFPIVTLSGKRGQKVKFIVGDKLSKDGHVDQSGTGAPHYYEYTLRGGGKVFFGDEFTHGVKETQEVFRPHFSYYGFKYIEVVGAVMKNDINSSGAPVVEDLKAAFVTSSAAKIGEFECSNPLLTKTWEMVNQSLRCNWKSVFTSDPNANRLPYLSQIWLNGDGIVYNFDARLMLEQEMRIVSDAQNADGSVGSIAPLYLGSMPDGISDSPEWGGAIVAIPYLYKLHYGDNKLFEQYKTQINKYIEYLSSKAQGNILNFGMGDWCDVGSASNGQPQNTEAALIATAHYYWWTKLAGMKDKAEAIKQAFIQKFQPNSQAAYAICLVMGLYGDGMKQIYLENLVADIHKNLSHITTGAIGTTYLFQALIENGQESLLYKMLDHYEMPGYGPYIDAGLGTMGNRWDPKASTNSNSFVLGHLNNFLIQDVAGIHVNGSKIEINPRFLGNMQWAKGATKTDKGEVKVSWKIQNGVFMLDVVTPDETNTTVNNEAISNMCTQRNLKLQCNVRAR